MFYTKGSQNPSKLKRKVIKVKIPKGYHWLGIGRKVDGCNVIAVDFEKDIVLNKAKGGR